ncbi:MAG: DUF4430 domain-containing protein [Candidatus Hermodarchaeota archaeon]
MKKNLKFAIITLIGISSFTVLILYSFGFFPILNQNRSGYNTGRDTALPEVFNISLTVEYVTQPTQTWENISLYNYDTTVLDALQEKCSVELSYFSNGALVIGINGVNGDWIYYVNDMFAGVGAADYYLNHGDKIYWKHVNI